MLTALAGMGYIAQRQTVKDVPLINSVMGTSVSVAQDADDALAKLEVKGRAAKTGYERSEFGNGWATVRGCDMRNRILQRDLTDEKLRNDNCVVLSGNLLDPYTGNTIAFERGDTTSSLVQIDHVVALSDAWQKGAQGWGNEKRVNFANDPLNLLAVDGKTNMDKGDGDAATWLPPNRAYRCRYIARQIAVKLKYSLWVTGSESDAMKRVLGACPEQVLPIER